MKKLLGVDVTDREYSFALKHPFQAKAAKDIGEAVGTLVRTLAIRNQIPGGRAGLHNGPADAVRHATLSCELTRSMGSETARTITDNHERNPGQPPAEAQMDLHNNAAGQQIAGASGSCIKNAVGALGSGDLMTSLPTTQ